MQRISRAGLNARPLRILVHLVLAAALGLGGLAACGGDDATAGNCVEHSDCDRGWYCSSSGVCDQQPCTRTAMCPGDGDLVCLEDLKSCSAQECVSSAAAGTEGACPAGMYCLNGTCLADTGGDPDTMDPGDTGGTTDDTKDPTGDVLVEEDIPVAPPAAECSLCASDADCGGDLTCEQLGATKNCLAPCTDDGECQSGWLCYPITNEGNACIPGAYQCTADCLAAGCPEGQACDQLDGSETHGQCIAALDACAPCAGYDWQCGAGHRCALTAAGMLFCVAECDAGVCPDWSTCMEKGGTGGTGVMICMPNNASCCGPDCGVDCDPECSGTLGQCHNGACVQCTADEHCTGTGETCDPTSYRCVGGLCSGTPSTPYECGGACCECQQDSHCATNDCDETTGTCAGGDACGGLCVDPYPGCATVNGVPSCVPCTDDAHCTPSTCDLTTYSCAGQTGENCNQDCVVAGCPQTTQFTLSCDPQTGCCYDTTGLCDNVSAFCRSETGSECKSIFEIFMGGALPGGGIPGMPTDGFAGGMCTCDAGGSTLCNLLPNNPICDTVPQCHEGGSCMGLGTIIQILMSLGGGAGGAPLIMGDFCTGGLGL